MKAFDEFKVLITVTGFNHYPNAKRLLEGDKVVLRREPENEYDKSAVAVYSDFGKIGYVANSERTVRTNTMKASTLTELITDAAVAEVVEGGYYEAICKVLDIYDIDKMILKACELYNAGVYDEAIVLFIKICERHTSILLMQYTADCFIKLGDYEKSLEFSQKAMELEENNKISLMMYATALFKLKRYQDAMEPYTKILEFAENKVVREHLNKCIEFSECKNEIE